jgi:8-oxo-dGTP diphosphatase
MFYKPHYCVVCALIEKDGKILAAKRNKNKSEGGYWELPGGKIRENEDPQSAIIREIKEEIDLDVEVIDELEAITYDYPDKTVLLMPFLCKGKVDNLKALEHEQIKFVDKNEIFFLNWLPPDMEILRRIFKK